MLEQIKAFVTETFGTEMAAALGQVYWLVVAPVFDQPTLHWAFISCSILVATIFFLVVLATPGERSLRNALGYVFPRAIYTHPSAVLDYKFWILTQYVFRYLQPAKFVIALAGIFYFAEGIGWALERVLGPSSGSAPPSAPVVVLFTVVFTIAYDFARWVTHFVHHRVRVLWEFHKVHHSASVLTPISSFRSHPVEQAIELFARTLAVGAVTAVFTYFYPVGIAPLTILGFAAISFIFHLVGHLRHSHVPISFGYFDRWFVSPHMHQLHHSAEPRHFDKNFGFIFSWWDRIAGTLYLPRREEKFDLGLPAEAGDYSSLTNLYFGPFIASARILSGRAPLAGVTATSGSAPGMAPRALEQRE